MKQTKRFWVLYNPETDKYVGMYNARINLVDVPTYGMLYNDPETAVQVKRGIKEQSELERLVIRMMIVTITKDALKYELIG